MAWGGHICQVSPSQSYSPTSFILFSEWMAYARIILNGHAHRPIFLRKVICMGHLSCFISIHSFDLFRAVLTHWYLSNTLSYNPVLLHLFCFWNYSSFGYWELWTSSCISLRYSHDQGSWLVGLLKYIFTSLLHNSLGSLCIFAFLNLKFHALSFLFFLYSFCLSHKKPKTFGMVIVIWLLLSSLTQRQNICVNTLIQVICIAKTFWCITFFP